MAAAIVETAINLDGVNAPVLGPQPRPEEVREDIGSMILADVARQYGVPADKGAVEAYERQNPGLALQVTMDAIRARLKLGQ